METENTWNSGQHVEALGVSCVVVVIWSLFWVLHVRSTIDKQHSPETSDQEN